MSKSKGNKAFKLTSELVEKACLETVYWWVDCEAAYHSVFKSKSINKNTQEVFYKFTKKYSVRRTLTGTGAKGKDATDYLLTKLNSEFYSKAKAAKDVSFVDDNAKAYTEKKIVSLLSKYATLISPDYFGMYDGNALWSLRQYDNEYKISDYASFFKAFTNFKTKELPKIKSKTIKYYLDMLQKRFKNLKSPITDQVFKNRLADKLLWVYFDDILKRK